MHAVPLGDLGRSEFVATVPADARSANLSHPGLGSFCARKTGPRFKRLRLRNKLLVECAVEGHDGQVAQDKNGA